MSIREMAEQITLADLLEVAGPITLASIIKDIDHNGHKGQAADMIRTVCWHELVSNVGAADALDMMQ
jgi:hypothetical protein